ncbi:hypothetical protein [Helicobacter pylori]|uniref:hypothetical protein n=1 Tax=Helicobacter pylori TaxID=210 RepID=UPI003C73AE12
MPFLESFWAVLYRKRLFFEMSEILTHPTLELAQNHLGFSIGLGDAPLLISQYPQASLFANLRALLMRPCVYPNNPKVR